MSKRDKVGYRKPPVHSRFLGKSGNPAGRPKKPKDTPKRILDVKEAFIDALSISVPLTEGTKKTEITGLQAVARSVVMRAIQGDRTMAKLALTLASGFTVQDFAKEQLFEVRDRNGRINYFTQANMDAMKEFVDMADADIAEAEAAERERAQADEDKAGLAESKTAEGKVVEVKDESCHEVPNESSHAPNNELSSNSDGEDLTLETGSILEDDNQTGEPDSDPDDDIASGSQ